MSFLNLAHLLIEFGAVLSVAYKVCYGLVLADSSLLPLPPHSTDAVFLSLWATFSSFSETSYFSLQHLCIC